MSMVRSRWAAVGAAVAVTLGAGGVTLVGAAKDSGDKPVTVFLDEPCRIRDTRPTKGVGGRTAPLGPTEAYTVQGTGPSGDCNIPNDAVGLVLNVTADQATEATNLRLYPTGGTVPTTSNLNPRPGAAPTPNAVTVGLNGSGEFDIRNAKGNVHIIIDVAAYLVDHTHDDRYYTQSEVDALLRSQRTTAAHDGGNSTIVLEDTPKSIATVTVDQPTSGRVILSSSATMWGEFTQGHVQCSITTGTTIDANYRQEIDYVGTTLRETISGDRGYVINKGVLFSPDTDDYHLVCVDVLDNPTKALDANLTAVFVPDPKVFKPIK